MPVRESDLINDYVALKVLTKRLPKHGQGFIHDLSGCIDILQINAGYWRITNGNVKQVVEYDGLPLDSTPENLLFIH